MGMPLFEQERKVCANYYTVITRSVSGHYTSTPFYEDGQAAQDYFDTVLADLRALKKAAPNQPPLKLILANCQDEIYHEEI